MRHPHYLVGRKRTFLLVIKCQPETGITGFFLYIIRLCFLLIVVAGWFIFSLKEFFWQELNNTRDKQGSSNIQ